MQEDESMSYTHLAPMDYTHESFALYAWPTWALLALVLYQG